MKCERYFPVLIRDRYKFEVQDNNMINRRRFIKQTAFTGFATLAASEVAALSQPSEFTPLVVSTWANTKANAKAWAHIIAGGRSLDAVINGVKVAEADPADTSVGYGGLPDRDGKVTLDSCVMDEFGNCGSVMALEHIMHAVLVARAIMETTPHVQLVGEGALKFALASGFKKQSLLTPAAEKAWKEWLIKSKYNPADTIHRTIHHSANSPLPYPWPGSALNHDTIGMVAMDTTGGISGACTTSGMAFKMNGRVGDSPIIGAGLFVDNEIGAATATGVGEEVVKVCGTHTIIESIRNGMSPSDACKEAVRRVVKNLAYQNTTDHQVGFLAINKSGEYGAYAVQKGFEYCVTTGKGTEILKSESWYK